MLQSLLIKNYAIIEQVEIQFSNQLNIITGETGAGKSIVMGAISLILGDRADTTVVTNKAEKCIVEAQFATKEKADVISFLNSNDFEILDTLLIRREITANGKSRSFINDTPATLQQLKQVANLLVDLHQQFDTQTLGEANFQRTVIDALANTQNDLKQYQKSFAAIKLLEQKVKAAIEEKSKHQQEKDYNEFLYNELATLQLKPNELEELEEELKLLTNAELIKQTLAATQYQLEDGEQPIINGVKQLINQLNNIEQFHTNIATLKERLQSSLIELKDIAEELAILSDTTIYDAERINTINEKISAGYKLQKKHCVNTTTELITIQESLLNKLTNAVNIENDLQVWQKQIETITQEAEAQSTNLFHKRNTAAKPFTESVNKLLHRVDMPNATLQVQINKTVLHPFGGDDIQFLFDANKTGKFEPLQKVASGGELSRLMLCIKSLVAESIDLPTLIFDEIDTGISGEAAKQVGNIMQQLTQKRQVICITHQPQIAGKAHKHFFVYKQTNGERLQTHIKVLTNEQRIHKIAQMLSGENPTAAALENAKEMVG